MADLHIKNVSKVYRIGGKDIKAVDHVSLDLAQGEFASIIGHSGSGKTTLLSMIGGILRSSSGSIFYGDTDINRLDADRLSEYRSEKIGYIFQFASLLQDLSVKENLLLPTVFKAGGQHPDARRKSFQKIEEYLDLVGLADKINVYPAQLSGGQQRRVAIARALMNDPEVILADEPTGDLDEQTEQEIMKLLLGVNKERNITFILVTHNSQLATIARRRLKMVRGRLCETIEPAARADNYFAATAYPEPACIAKLSRAAMETALVQAGRYQT